MRKAKKWQSLILLQGVFLLYSFAAICSKLVSQATLFSAQFFLLVTAAFLLLLIYAVLWQQLLKTLPLTVAFANKGVVVIWGMVWGALIFQERITVPMVLGAVLICAGIGLVSSDA